MGPMDRSGAGSLPIDYPIGAEVLPINNRARGISLDIAEYWGQGTVLVPQVDAWPANLVGELGCGGIK